MDEQELQNGRCVPHRTRNAIAKTYAPGSSRTSLAGAGAAGRSLSCARTSAKGPKAAYPWLLKGGYAMESWMHAARTTKDIALTPHDGPRLSKDR